jgi:hypothetical protein
VGSDTKDVICGWFIEVQERWKVVGGCEKALVLKCSLVILLVEQGTKFDRNGDDTRECYVRSVE